MSDRTDVQAVSPAGPPQDHPTVIVLAVSHDDGPRVLIDTSGREQFLDADRALELVGEITAAIERLQLL